MLNYKKEIEEITSSLSKSSNLIYYSIDMATKKTFFNVLSESPVVVHFSGHGIKNTKSNIDWEKYEEDNEKKGLILLFENKHSGLAKDLY